MTESAHDSATHYWGACLSCGTSMKDCQEEDGTCCGPCQHWKMRRTVPNWLTSDHIVSDPSLPPGVFTFEHADGRREHFSITDGQPVKTIPHTMHVSEEVLRDAPPIDLWSLSAGRVESGSNITWRYRIRAAIRRRITNARIGLASRIAGFDVTSDWSDD